MARQYTDDDKATALAALQANGGNLKRTARELKIPMSTLSHWRDGQGINQNVVELGDQKKEELGALFERACRVYLQHAINSKTVAATKGRDAIMAAAIAADKKQLLSGKPTTISANEYTNMSDAELAARLAELDRLARDNPTPLISYTGTGETAGGSEGGTGTAPGANGSAHQNGVGGSEPI